MFVTLPGITICSVKYLNLLNTLHHCIDRWNPIMELSVTIPRRVHLIFWTLNRPPAYELCVLFHPSFSASFVKWTILISIGVTLFFRLVTWGDFSMIWRCTHWSWRVTAMISITAVLTMRFKQSEYSAVIVCPCTRERGLLNCQCPIEPDLGAFIDEYTTLLFLHDCFIPIRSESPLAQLYGTSTMEHHHFDHSIMILNSEVKSIFIVSRNQED